MIFAGARLRTEASYDAQHEYLVHIPWRGQTAPAMMMRPSRTARRAGCKECVCVIYFHAISCDIGDCFDDLTPIRDSAFGGNAVVFAPEYPGYGLLRDYSPSVEGINQVAEAAFDFCRRGLGFARDRIILWGRSIGTGPAATLARVCGASCQELGTGVDKVSAGCCSPTQLPCDMKQTSQHFNAKTVQSLCRTERPADGSRPIGGLVLVAPLTSVADVVMTITKSATMSALVGPMWEVAEMVKHPGLCTVPLCILHTVDDKVVPFAQGEEVLTGAVMRPKLGVWLQGGGHNFNLLQDSFHIPTCGEFRAIGLWLSIGTYMGRHAYQLDGDPMGIVYWNTEYQEWRLYFKDKMQTATLFHSRTDTVSVPTSGWKANDGTSMPPVIEKQEQPLLIVRQFMAEHAGHGGLRQNGSNWEWSVQGERRCSRPRHVEDIICGSNKTDFSSRSVPQEASRPKPPPTMNWHTTNHNPIEVEQLERTI